jgi:hypothetical protein
MDAGTATSLELLTPWQDATATLLEFLAGIASLC